MIEATIIGNLGADAEMKDFGGRKFISFRVASTKRFKDAQGNRQERTTWVDVLRYSPDDSPALLPYLTKGTQVYVEGEPSVRAWTDKDGNAQATLNLSASRIELLGSRRDDNQAQPAPQTQPTDNQYGLPF